jgi:hypothetical protein
MIEGAAASARELISGHALVFEWHRGCRKYRPIANVCHGPCGWTRGTAHELTAHVAHSVGNSTRLGRGRP